MNPEAFKELIDQYITGDLSPENRAAFSALLEQQEYRSLLESELQHTFMADVYEGAEPLQRKERLNQLIRERIATDEVLTAASVHRIHMLKRGWVRMAAASIVLLLLGGGAWLFLSKSSQKQLAAAPQRPAAEIAPGHNGAVLTLADGSKLVLDSLKKGKLATQGGAELLLDNDQLSYKVKNSPEAAITYNVLNVPRGRQFQLVLPDGSKVWLNAASMLRYPTAFVGKERRVEVSGEAYFEVAHNAAMPFIVKKGETEIKVLGTHFNVNAYDDESIESITLLEGSVEVTNKDNRVVIKPGQQAQVGGGIKVAGDVDLDEVVAWKDGKFQFGETADIQTVMHQIANWYDVDIVYKGTVRNHIGGTIPRSVNLSLLLKMLETTGVVDFKIKGKSVEVIPK